METTPIEMYVWPTDGYDWCFSCNYLEKVHTTMLLDSDNVTVPLCFECAIKIGEA